MDSYRLSDPLPFYRIVWEIVRQIPEGEAATYGQIAAMIPPPTGVEPADYARLGPKWVGEAMNAVSVTDEPSVPWHRVVNARGGISMSDLNPVSALQRGRLRHEGLLNGDAETVDLAADGWDGPDLDWVSAHGLRPAKPLRQRGDDPAPTQLSLF
jgi:methylated-DNA-protein-cysteine methyltransferase-like protein